MTDLRQLPDLIGVIATNGKQGFIKTEDFRVQPLTPAQVDAKYARLVAGCRRITDAYGRANCYAGASEVYATCLATASG